MRSIEILGVSAATAPVRETCVGATSVSALAGPVSCPTSSSSGTALATTSATVSELVTLRYGAPTTTVGHGAAGSGGIAWTNGSCAGFSAAVFTGPAMNSVSDADATTASATAPGATVRR
jgi:hypothetical protein